MSHDKLRLGIRTNRIVVSENRNYVHFHQKLKMSS